MKYVETSKGVKPIGPYSQAIVSNGLVYLSGQIAIDPATNAMVSGGIREQTKQVLDNVRVVLEAAGSGLGKVLKTSVFISETSLFKEMNEVYAAAFGGHKPARTTVVCGFVKEGILVEIDVVATV